MQRRNVATGDSNETETVIKRKIKMLNEDRDWFAERTEKKVDANGEFITTEEEEVENLAKDSVLQNEFEYEIFVKKSEIEHMQHITEILYGKQCRAAALAALCRCTTYFTNISFFSLYVVMQRRNVATTT